MAVVATTSMSPWLEVAIAEEDLGIRLVLNRFGLGLPSGFTTFYTAPEGYYQTTRVGQG